MRGRSAAARTYANAIARSASTGPGASLAAARSTSRSHSYARMRSPSTISAFEAKYVYGNHGEGFFSFLGGHDPEDFQHFVGEPPTDLRFYRNSPGYRLILNNLLFPAARREELKT